MIRYPGLHGGGASKGVIRSRIIRTIEVSSNVALNAFPLFAIVLHSCMKLAFQQIVHDRVELICSHMTSQALVSWIHEDDPKNGHRIQ